MAEAKDMKESGPTGRLGLAASILLAAYRSTLHSLRERGARATLEVLAVPPHPTTNHPR
jgi:hypothetical protein